PRTAAGRAHAATADARSRSLARARRAARTRARSRRRARSHRYQRMIRFEGVTITYADADRPALRDVDLVVPAGELCVVVGGTGSGKTTLLGAINGLVPHFTGGVLRG